MSDEHGFTDADITILRDIVTDAVTKHMKSKRKYDPQLVGRLRRYERSAWAIGLDAHTIQVITSGRRLLGDHESLRPRASWMNHDISPEPTKLASRAA